MVLLSELTGHTDEFYEVTDGSFSLFELRRLLFEWEQVPNMVRPHQALVT